MKRIPNHAFADIPGTAHGLFAIMLHAAVYRLIDHIRRLNKLGGEPLESTFERYPFLANYFTELRQRMPEDISWERGVDWWRQEIAAWEEEHGSGLPLAILEREQGLDFRARVALLLIGLIEEDSRFGTIFAELQAPLNQRRPTLELVGWMLQESADQGSANAWPLCRFLLNIGLIVPVDEQAPRSEWVLQVPMPVWDTIRGYWDVQPVPGCRYQAPATLATMDELVFSEEFLQRLHKLPSLLATGKVNVLVLRSDPGDEPLEILGAVAGALQRGVLSIEHPEAVGAWQWRMIGILCAMYRCIPVLHYDPGPGETVQLPTFTGYSGPLGVILGQEGGLAVGSMEKVLALALPWPLHALRRRYWQRALDGQPAADLDGIAGTFHLAGGYIRQLGPMAITRAGLDGRRTVTLDDVREASRALNRQLLDTLAGRVEAQGSWEDLVVTETTRDKLLELAQRCRHRERLLGRLGAGFDHNTNRGVRALFTGVSGTGKTLAASVLAAELGMDLYRVDLAAVINKYIGETEKNLHKVLSYAEALDVILLLDEGDALLGNRTEVKSANDRYANLETNYLLQRLENYQGIVVVTTNLGENIDRGFQRRMDVVVPFHVPGVQERWSILLLHLPADHEVDEPTLQRVARHCTLSGGQLRNVAQHATLLSLEAGEPLTRYHLEQALRSEYRKIGGVFPLIIHHAGESDDGMAAFVAALQGY